MMHIGERVDMTTKKERCHFCHKVLKEHLRIYSRKGEQFLTCHKCKMKAHFGPSKPICKKE